MNSHPSKSAIATLLLLLLENYMKDIIIEELTPCYEPATECVTTKDELA